MDPLWGKVKHFLENQKILWNLSNFIGPSVKMLVFLILFSENVSSCPLDVVSAASPPPSINPSHNYPYDENVYSALEEFGESRIFSGGSTSELLTSMALKIVRFLVKNLMGEQWLSEDIALRRLDAVKSSLFKYYAQRNLFGGTVETARDGGIGFPSLEGALLSLAFLTFSVFLIDLIQNILNRLRIRNASTAAPAAAILGRTFGEMAQINSRENITKSLHPIYIDTLTTLSSKVISAIEKPWQYYETS